MGCTGQRQDVGPYQSINSCVCMNWLQVGRLIVASCTERLSDYHAAFSKRLPSPEQALQVHISAVMLEECKHAYDESKADILSLTND